MQKCFGKTLQIQKVSFLGFQMRLSGPTSAHKLTPDHPVATIRAGTNILSNNLHQFSQFKVLLTVRKTLIFKIFKMLNLSIYEGRRCSESIENVYFRSTFGEFSGLYQCRTPSLTNHPNSNPHCSARI